VATSSNEPVIPDPAVPSAREVQADSGPVAERADGLGGKALDEADASQSAGDRDRLETHRPTHPMPPDGGQTHPWPIPLGGNLQPGEASVPRVWTSEQLFGDAVEVIIQHNAQWYRLRRTRNGKLILCK
jgi:hemin uptake protein HemP